MFQMKADSTRKYNKGIHLNYFDNHIYKYNIVHIYNTLDYFILN